MTQTTFLNTLIRKKENNNFFFRKESNFVTWKVPITIKSLNEAVKTFLISTHLRALNRLVLHKVICEIIMFQMH